MPVPADPAKRVRDEANAVVLIIDVGRGHQPASLLIPGVALLGLSAWLFYRGHVLARRVQAGSA